MSCSLMIKVTVTTFQHPALLRHLINIINTMHLNSQSLNYEYECNIIVLAVFHSCRLFSVVYCALAPALSTSVTAARVPSTIAQTVTTSSALLTD